MGSLLIAIKARSATRTIIATYAPMMNLAVPCFTSFSYIWAATTHLPRTMAKKALPSLDTATLLAAYDGNAEAVAERPVPRIQRGAARRRGLRDHRLRGLGSSHAAGWLSDLLAQATIRDAPKLMHEPMGA